MRTETYFGKWMAAASIRALKTAAQTALGVIGASAMLSDVDWMVVLSSAALAALCSYLTSTAGIPELKAKDGGKGIEVSD